MTSDGSRIPKFYRLPVEERRAVLAARLRLTADDLALLDGGGLDLDMADAMIENVVGVFGLPFGVALNFRVNGRDHVVPMVVEEPSVVAAASNAARMVRDGGGFTAETDPPVMTAQVQLLDVDDPDRAIARILAAREEILAKARESSEGVCVRGGGPRDVSARVLSRPGQPDGGMVVVHIHVDCRDAMGANLVNTVAESLASRLVELAGPDARAGLRILTNLADRRRVRVRARVPLASLGAGDEAAAARDGIIAASRFAELDPYRATTHNKGIMNGVDAVLLATGNDWRGVEAGAHAYAARGGGYAPLAVWRRAGDDLEGELELPMAVGTVGGALRAHPLSRLAVRMIGVETATELGAVVAAAGLASNLAALRALATEGIQRGHMALHQRALDRAATRADATLEEVRK